MKNLRKSMFVYLALLPIASCSLGAQEFRSRYLSDIDRAKANLLNLETQLNASAKEIANYKQRAQSGDKSAASWALGTLATVEPGHNYLLEEYKKAEAELKQKLQKRIGSLPRITRHFSAK
jgi:hypothetical protein